MRLFQAVQQGSRISLEELKARFESQLPRMNCRMVSTGFGSGDLGGKGKRVMFSGIFRALEPCQPA